MQVLVVGGTGFIGSHVVDALLAAGHRVRVLAPHPELFRPANPAVGYYFGRLEVGAHLDDAIDGCDAVIDSVSSSVPASADQSPASSIATSVGAATWLGELCRRLEVGTLVYLSSGGTVYGRGTGDAVASKETDALAPIGTYGAAKAASELSLAALLGVSPVRYVGLRIANAYGERQNPDRPQGIVGVALARMRAGVPLTLYGDTVRDLVHAADIASAVVQAVESPEMSGPYNVGSGDGVAMSELLATLQSITGRELELDHRPIRPFDVPYSVVDTSRAAALGWSPQVGLAEGLDRTWRWYRDATS